MEEKNKNTECCPRFDPTPWNDKEIKWDKKQFIKDKVFTLFYIPLNFGAAMKRLSKKVETYNAAKPEFLCLSEHTSQWNINLYLEVSKFIPKAENVTMSGKYYSKVYEGDFQNTGTWHKDFETVLKEKGYNSKRVFMWYTTCPKCAKEYGKNYVVFIAEIS